MTTSVQIFVNGNYKAVVTEQDPDGAVRDVGVVGPQETKTYFADHGVKMTIVETNVEDRVK